MLVVIIGTYLDLFFVGMGMYSFPNRLFPNVFTINIAFTLFVLPIFTFVLLLIIKNMTPIKRWICLLLTSLMIASMERLAESLGYFIHSEQWKHIYSFIGYFVFMAGIWGFYRWIK
jgi:hypothetical protein